MSLQRAYNERKNELTEYGCLALEYLVCASDTAHVRIIVRNGRLLILRRAMLRAEDEVVRIETDDQGRIIRHSAGPSSMFIGLDPVALMEQRGWTKVSSTIF